MYFTIAISAASRQRCAALVSAAQDTDPRVMPLPGPARLGWQAPDGCTAIVHWGAPDPARASHAGTIWISAPPAVLRARTGLARVDPVYLAELPDAVVVGDRASWVAAVAGRLNDHDPVMVGAFLSVGYPIGAATPFRGVRAMAGGQTLQVSGGRMVRTGPDDDADPLAAAAFARGGPPGAHPVGGALAGVALAEAVRPLGEKGDGSVPVELSLTGGKDSRLIAAALAAAGVPFRARTHGFASHPDVIIAGMIAERLGVEHTVTEPRPATQAPDQAELLGRLRGAVLVSDGMLSAFENVGSWVRAEPADGAAAVAGPEPVHAGGHGGELLRGGYAQAAWRPARRWKSTRAWSDAAAVELFRRLTTRRLRLLRPGAAAAYLASLGPATAALAGGPLRALDDFYLLNRAGRWSAAARQAY